MNLYQDLVSIYYKEKGHFFRVTQTMQKIVPCLVQDLMNDWWPIRGAENQSRNCRDYTECFAFVVAFAFAVSCIKRFSKLMNILTMFMYGKRDGEERYPQ